MRRRTPKTKRSRRFALIFFLVSVYSLLTGDLARTIFGQRVGRAQEHRSDAADWDDVKPLEDFAIIVLAMNRTSSLLRLLYSIENSFYGGASPSLHIKFDAANRRAKTIAAADSFQYSHGHKHIQRSNHSLGLAKSWFLARDSTGHSNHFIILEDDIELSPYWFIWLSKAWQSYADRDDLSGISLQRQTLIPYKPAKYKAIRSDGTPFLYPIVGSIGFSPNPILWDVFTKWALNVSPTYDISTTDLVTSDWWNQGDPRHMWTQHFIYFSVTYRLFCMYVNLENGQALASHHREPGAHFKKTMGVDFRPTSRLPRFDFPTHPTKYDFTGTTISSEKRQYKMVEGMIVQAARQIQNRQGFAYLLFLNSGFSAITMSWLCNIQLLDVNILQNVIFIAGDYETARKISRRFPKIVVFTRPSSVTRSVSFGSYEYYGVVLDRMKVENMLIQSGINTQVIESDQIWLADITSTLRDLFNKHLVIAGEESAYHAQSHHKRLCGGFYGIASTPQTRLFFQQYVNEHEQRLISKKKKNKNKDSKLSGFEDDQSRLSRLLRQNQIHTYWLSPCFYANGLWFDIKEFRSKCPKPHVIHNNYIVGNSAKVDRAILSGHWYYKNTSCVQPKI